MTKNIRYKRYLKHAAVWASIVLVSGLVFALPAPLTVVLIALTLLGLAIWYIDDIISINNYNKYRQEMFVSFFAGIGITILLGTIGLLIYFQPKTWGGMIVLTIGVPIVIFVVEFMIAMGRSYSYKEGVVEWLSGNEDMIMRAVPARFFNGKSSNQ